MVSSHGFGSKGANSTSYLRLRLLAPLTHQSIMQKVRPTVKPGCRYTRFQILFTPHWVLFNVRSPYYALSVVAATNEKEIPQLAPAPAT